MRRHWEFGFGPLCSSQFSSGSPLQDLLIALCMTCLPSSRFPKDMPPNSSKMHLVSPSSQGSPKKMVYITGLERSLSILNLCQRVWIWKALTGLKNVPHVLRIGASWIVLNHPYLGKWFWGGTRCLKIISQNHFFWGRFFNIVLMSQNHFCRQLHLGTSNHRKSLTSDPPKIISIG